MRRRALLLTLTPCPLLASSALPATVVHFVVEAPELTAEAVQAQITLPLEAALQRLPAWTRSVTASMHGRCVGELAFEGAAGGVERTQVAAVLARAPALRARLWRVHLAAPQRLRLP